MMRNSLPCALSLLLTATTLHAQDVDWWIRENLAGLRSVAVIVRVEGAPVEETTIRTMVELALRRAGIVVSADSASAKWNIGVSLQGVELHSTSGTHAGYMTGIQLQVFGLQDVWLPNATRTLGVVLLWDRFRAVSSGPDQIVARETIERQVRQFVDEFLNDWRAANPRR